jgi:hypothetical protein
MGYYTYFRLEVTPESEEVRRVTEEDESYSYALSESGGDSCKWYDHESDMRELSSRFPNQLFELTGEGEEAGDLWVKYFKDGKMQSCPAIITYDPFDASKLR